MDRLNTEPEQIFLEQNTEEWLQWRKDISSASDAAVIMGEQSDWQPQSWHDMRLRDLEDNILAPNAAMEKGNALEPIAREIYNDEIAFLYDEAPTEPICFETVIDGHKYGASYDGLSMAHYDIFAPNPETDYFIICEIKVPFNPHTHKLSKLHDGYEPMSYDAGTDYFIKNVPRYIYWQMLHQAMVLLPKGEIRGTLVVHMAEDIDSDGENFYYPFTTNNAKIQADIGELRGMWFRYNEGGDEPDVSIHDGEYLILEENYLILKDVIDYNKAELAEIKEAMLDIVRQNNYHHNDTFEGNKIRGSYLTKYSYDWKNVPESLMEELEQYKTKENKYWRLYSNE